MKAPMLNRRLVLEAPTRTADGAGGYSAGWAEVGVLWAEVVAGALGEQGGVGTPIARALHRITVRAAPVGAEGRPKPDQRFREGTRVFRILAVTERDAGGRWLMCQTDEEVAG
jgi:head-tail adaptor